MLKKKDNRIGLISVIVTVIILSYGFLLNVGDKKINKQLTNVADEISTLMKKYHYNPGELETEEYKLIENKIYQLANSVNSKDEFISSFNNLWKNGPFSHVRLGIANKSASEIAGYIDSLKVGPKAVSLEFNDNTAILTVNTMIGIDTKISVNESFEKISKQNIDNLIIDLRNNTGGTFAGIPLIAHIIGDSLEAGVFISNKWWKNNKKYPEKEEIKKLTPWNGWSLKKFWSDVQENPLTKIKICPMKPQFKGKIIILTGEKTASAAELTIDALANSNNVTIIGEKTAGEMLSQKMYDLPLNLQLSIPIADYISARIGRIEGKGINPDIMCDSELAMKAAQLFLKGLNKEEIRKALSKKIK